MLRAQTFIVNGSFDHAISPLDRGFAYGDGVFRTMVVCSGLPECWPQHYQKLVADCAAIKIVCPSAELLISDLQQLFSEEEVAKNSVAVVKIIITRGEGERGYAPPAITNPLRVLIKTDIPVYPSSYFSEGVHLHVCNTTLAAQPSLAGVKHLNRLENVLARMEWTDPNVADGIMLDSDQQVIECTSANVFICNGNTLLTPSLNQCGIAGITRQRIMDLAHLIGLTVKVESFNLDRLFAAEAVLITNSLYGVFQAKRVQQKTWAPTSLAVDIREILKV
ncbi:MAG: aminodeoxychorismate lyase [Pseudomonadota bacterium]